MSEYINVVSNGMDEVRNIATNSQTDILKELGIGENSFIKYQAQLGPFMQELMMKQGQPAGDAKQLSLEEVKYALRLQV